ncbi:hypothetical protein sos41_02590 [Alphaproteobacteria bacterium SO-S41]|nr:hypothetical protein sos41_02590 [Alphaproteobacteria bacterium SO-S41]
MPRGFIAAHSDYEVDAMRTPRGKPLFEEIGIEWSIPRIWPRGAKAPVPDEMSASKCVYAIVRNHGRQQRKNTIEYIGLASHAKNRFANHPKARELADMRGETALSFGCLSFIDRSASKKQGNIKQTLEQVEHILIHALQPLSNDRKVWMLPGAGKNPSRAWHIRNLGFRFSGQMPREIVFPWILIRPGRDRSLISAAT